MTAFPEYRGRYHVDCAWSVVGVAFWSNGGNKSKCDALMAIGTMLGELRVYNVATGALVGNTRCHSDLILCVAFAPDGKTVATGSQDCTIAIYSVEHQSVVVHAIRLHKFAVCSLVFSPDGKKLVSGACNQFIVSDIDAVQHDRSVSVTESMIDSISYAPNGKTLACGLRSGEIRLFDAETNIQLLKKQAHDRPVQCLMFSPDDSKILASSTYKAVWIWDVERDTALQLLWQHTVHIGHIEFSPNGKLFLSCASYFKSCAPYGVSDGVAIWSTHNFASQTHIINGLNPMRVLESNQDTIIGVSFFNINCHIMLLTRRNMLGIRSLLEYRLVVLIATSCLKISLAPYVLLDIVNFLLAKKNACRFDCEEAFLHAEKVYCIERLRALSSNHHRCDRHTV